MMQQRIQVKKHEPSGTIVLNRPEKRNALSRWMMVQIGQALDDLHQQREVRAVILSGAGSAFCAGLDIEEIQQTAKQRDALDQWHRDAVQIKELYEKMMLFPKPIIAAVNGPAAGAGAGLVLAADIVIASPQARFGMPEPRLGLVSGLTAPLLAFRVGAGPAANLLLGGRLIDAGEAHRLGVYHELTSGDTIWARAHEVATQCAKCAPESLQLTKRVLNETVGHELGTLLSSGAAASATARTTEAAHEGMAAFLEKREPDWP